jgi:ABC-type lipoprotein export system ATPase subunit
VNAPEISALELRDVAATGCEGEVVRGFTASFAPRRFHLLRGPDGCGKNLLLRLVGLLQPPETGEVIVQGLPTRALSEEARAELRAQRFGFVFNAPFLLTSFTVIENVAMPLFKISHVAPDEARRRTESVLAFAGLAGMAESPIGELSLRAQYQLAVARGLINEPEFLIVENLDGVLAGEDLSAFIELLHRASAEYGTTIIATASPALAADERQDVLDIAGHPELSPETGA